MKKSLVLAEKPSVGKDISRVLGCSRVNNSYHENNKYVVTWALGHLVTLASPEKYNKEYTNWKLETLPMIPNPFKLEVIKQTSKQFSQVKHLMDRNDISEIIIATDAGREGELVARWIIDYARCKKPIRRLWISSVTDSAIKKGFSNLSDGNKYNRLYSAAKARAQADWIVGINGTRALTCKNNASLSMGRVQTPTLTLILDREKEIRNFVSKNFYEIAIQVEGITCKWFDSKTGQTRLFNEKEAQNIVKLCTNKKGTVTKFEEINKKSYPKGIYDLTELQRDANRLYGFSAKETLNTMQTLYERHKVLTYPRTDSKYITTDIVDTLPERVIACRNSSYKDIANKILKSPIKGNPSFVNDSKVGDHHGIIPTEEIANTRDFTPKELKIYNLVIQRFLSVLLPPYEYKEISIEIDIDGNKFKGKELINTNLGWKIVYEKSNNIQPSKQIKFKKSDITLPLNTKINIGKTQPPSYLTEGELLHEMEKSSLGTVATRGDIIEKIIDNQYVDKQNNFLRITKTGKQLLDLVPDDLRSKELTSKWEKDLEAISLGKKDEKTFMKEIIEFTNKIINEIKTSTDVFKHDNISSENCPQCGQKLLIIENKHGKKLVCRDRECGYKKTIASTTNARCPNCHKKMDLVGDESNKTFVCKCGYKEKLENFNKRKETKSKEMSKKEVQRYLKSSNKSEESFNNPFADLLKNMEKNK